MKYIPQPKASPDLDHDYNSSPRTIVVHEDIPRTFTGLYDHNGNELHRVPNPIGFNRRFTS